MIKDIYEELHRAVVELISFYGKPFPKTYGGWFILRLNDGTFLELNSFNNSVYRKIGTGEYNETLGFEGRVINKVGSTKDLQKLGAEYRRLIGIILSTTQKHIR